MITGNGDVASVLFDREDFVFFASGVSNSKEERESEYNREFELLREQDQSKRIVYFSSLAIFYSDSRYTRHKKEMEAAVKRWFPKYTIIRLGNITWGTNPHTIINYFKKLIKEDQAITTFAEPRFIISKEEFLYWIKWIPDWNVEMNCPGRMIMPRDIVEEIKAGKL